jgi:hypothetical protein
MILVFSTGGRSSSDAGFAATRDSRELVLHPDKIRIMSRSKNVQQKASRGSTTGSLS